MSGLKKSIVALSLHSQSFSLISLPKTLCLSIVGNWLSLNDFCNLDTSYCSHADRTKFTSRVYANNFCLVNRILTSYVALPVKCLEWFSTRKISVLNICLNLESECDLKVAAFHSMSKSVLYKLYHLKMCGFTSIMAKKLIQSVSQSTSVKVFEFQYTPSVLCLPIEKTLLPACYLPSSITHLQLTNCVIIDDVCFTTLHKKCDSLTSVELTNCHYITDHGMHILLKHVGNSLKTLSVVNDKLLTVETFNNIRYHHCNKLAHLTYKSYDRITMDASSLIEECCQLSTLLLHNCVVIMEKDCKHTYRYLTKLSVEVSTSSTSSSGSVTHVTALIRACPNLKQLEITNRTTDRSTAVLDCMQKIQQDSMHGLVCSFPLKLTTVHLHQIGHLLDSHVETLLTTCTALRSLSVLHCDSLTNDTLVAVAVRGNSLTALNISSCDGITTAGVLTLLRQSVTLRTLIARNCQRVLQSEVTKGNAKNVKIIL